MGSAIVWTGLFAPDFHLPKPLTLRACQVRTKTPNPTLSRTGFAPDSPSNADAADQSSTIEGLGKEQIAPERSRGMASSVKAVMK